MQRTKEKILRAAYKEFESHGYSQASTNKIVSEAGVSKGTLFNYFGSKENLYHSSIEHAIDVTITETNAFQYEKPGFIERMYELMQLKQAIQMRHPELTQFLSKAYLDKTLPDNYHQQLDEFRDKSLNQLLEGVDVSNLRDDLPKDRMMDLIRWTLDGYAEQMKNMWQMGLIDLEKLEPYYEDFEKHLDVMKKLYYKE